MIRSTCKYRVNLFFSKYNIPFLQNQCFFGSFGTIRDSERERDGSSMSEFRGGESSSWGVAVVVRSTTKERAPAKKDFKM